MMDGWMAVWMNKPIDGFINFWMDEWVDRVIDDN